jgi:hypothetical protein
MRVARVSPVTVMKRVPRNVRLNERSTDMGTGEPSGTVSLELY